MNRLNSFTRLVGFGALAIGSWTSHALAQDSLQVTFVGDRELEIREVTKPPASPQRVDLGIAKPTIQYAPVAKGMSPVTEIEALAPLAVRMDAPLPRLYAGYAKLGFGMYTSPYADIHLGETQSRKGAWGLHLHHSSSAGSTGAVDSLGVDEGWSHNGLHGHLRRFIDRSSLTVDAGIARQAWGLYGLDLGRAATGDFFAPVDRQHYLTADVSVRLQNHLRDSAKVHRDLELAMSRLMPGASPLPGNVLTPEILPPNQRENLLTARGDFQTWREGARYHLGLEGHLIGTQLSGIGDSTFAAVSRSSALVGATPSVTKERGAYKIRVGAGLWVDARGRQAFHFYPTAEVRFRLLDDVFVPYGGVDGGMQRNALHDLVAQNPWFEAGYHADGEALRGAIQHTNRALELYGGVRGKFTRDLAFNAQARTTTYRDFGFWVNESGLDSAGQRFSLAYDTLTVASVIGEASWRGQGALELSARAEFHTYGTGQQPHAWYQPRTRLSASGRWNVEELLFVDFGMEVVGARTAPSYVPFSAVQGDGEALSQEGAEPVGDVFGTGMDVFARKLPAYTALDLGVEYRYNGRLALGLDAKGPLGRTEVFNGFGAQRMRVMMWAGYRF